MSTTTTPDYGEPWIADQEHIFDRSGSAVADIWCPHSERITSCVNALAGIPDPEAALQAAREALDESRRFYINVSAGSTHVDRKAYSRLCDAIDLLTPPTK